MANLIIYDKNGKNSSKTMELNEDLFGLEVNEHLLYLAKVRQESNARGGNAHCKTRPEVRGGGAKPWKQKGTGRARAGTKNSPLWRGGGVMHGPRNNVNWTKGMNRKESVRALFHSILLAQKEDRLAAIEELTLGAAKTKEFCNILKQAELCTKNVVFVVDSENAQLENLERASRNLADKKVLPVSALNVKDLLKADKVVISVKALDEINTRFLEVAESAKFQKELFDAMMAEAA